MLQRVFTADLTPASGGDEGRPGLPVLPRRPGGVQNHVRDLAEVLRAVGTRSGSSRPASRPRTSAGVRARSPARRWRSRYNGSVARLAFGPRASAAARRVAARRRLRPAARPRAARSERVRCWPSGPATCRSSRPSTPRTSRSRTLAAVASVAPAQHWRRSRRGSRCPRPRARPWCSTWAESRS